MNAFFSNIRSLFFYEWNRLWNMEPYILIILQPYLRGSRVNEKPMINMFLDFKIDLEKLD